MLERLSLELFSVHVNIFKALLIYKFISKIIFLINFFFSYFKSL